MRKLLTFLLLCFSVVSHAQGILIEAEGFEHKGGWKVDQQFMDYMGSPYLIAHGLGKAVDDATTSVNVEVAGTYKVYVRTYNWTAPWYKGKGPGRFSLFINGCHIGGTLGCEGSAWEWQLAGEVHLKAGEVTLRLHDLTGFDGRCDAIYLTQNASLLPPSDRKELADFRRKQLRLPATPPSAGEFDLVVVGAGIAGMSAATTAARLGCKVALIHDRPVVGGNNSSEVRVHLGGRIEAGPYKHLGDLQKEFGPVQGGNAQPASFYEDDKKMEWITSQKGVKLFTNYHVTTVEKTNGHLTAVIAKNIVTGDEKRFEAPLFADCTGDGNIGYLAGADYRMGREGREEFMESLAPIQADSMTMGASVQWYSIKSEHPKRFPVFEYGLSFNDSNCERVDKGEWTWETGMDLDQMSDFERIRDYGMLVVYSNWSYLKNRLHDNKAFRNRELGWVAYIAGKRESRRLLGDYILSEQDIVKRVAHEDATFTTTWSIDLHRPDSLNALQFPDEPFKATTTHTLIHPYAVPYRCLYSRNIDNLFMAGRDISVTHVALGTTRVMRTTGMMGEVVGMASAICTQKKVKPREVYWHYLPELKRLMCKGIGKTLPNNQTYNLGGTLGE